MAAFFLELFSEEIPARMQPRAAADLARLITESLAGLSPTNIQTWYGPRRIALAADVNAEVAAIQDRVGPILISFACHKAATWFRFLRSGRSRRR